MSTASKNAALSPATSARVTALHHYTIGCAPCDLTRLVSFYVDIVGLSDGPRPALKHPGHWLYCDGHAIVHLNALLESTPPTGSASIDHISFRAHGLARTRDVLGRAGTAWHEAPLAGTSLHQVFVRDPCGVKIELTFDLDDDDQPVA